jgi:hypothetical protein
LGGLGVGERGKEEGRGGVKGKEKRIRGARVRGKGEARKGKRWE